MGRRNAGQSNITEKLLCKYWVVERFRDWIIESHVRFLSGTSGLDFVHHKARPHKTQIDYDIPEEEDIHSMN